MDKSVWIVIAAYNEGHSVPNVVKDLQKAGYQNIVVVDDGSKDNTFEAAGKTGATVLQHVINRGQGASLKTGIDYALQQNADVIVTFDADGQHRVQDLPAIIQPVADGEADISFGSRFLKKTKVPLMRRILLKGSIAIIFLFYGIKMTDAHNGFRALSRYAAQKIRITADRMEHASEFIEETQRNQLKYAEVPVVIKYTEATLKRGHGGVQQAIKVFNSMLFKKFFPR